MILPGTFVLRDRPNRGWDEDAAYIITRAVMNQALNMLCIHYDETYNEVTILGSNSIIYKISISTFEDLRHIYNMTTLYP